MNIFFSLVIISTKKKKYRTHKRSDPISSYISGTASNLFEIRMQISPKQKKSLVLRSGFNADRTNIILITIREAAKNKFFFLDSWPVRGGRGERAWPLRRKNFF